MAGSVADIVRRAARDFPHAAAVISDSATWTWQQIDSAADVGATELRNSSLRPGERLLLSLPTSAELAVAIIAALRADLVAVPVDADRADLSATADRVGAAGVIAVHADALPGLEPSLTRADVASWFASRAAPVEPQRGGEDLAVLARANRPGQVAMISHRAIQAAVTAIVAAPNLSPHSDDRVLQALPLFHLAGLVTVFLPSASVGAAVVLTETPPVLPRQVGSGAWAAFGAAVLASVQRHRVTVLPGAPPLYRLLLRSAELETALASVRVLTSAASPLRRADGSAVRERIGSPVWEGYGITESSSAVCSALMSDEPRPGSVGPPLPGVEVRIETADDVDEPAGMDLLADVEGDADPGRIAVRGPQLFSGYWPDGTGGPDADGWFATSDVGYLDERGELHLIDRLPETIVVAGFTVYPRGVESELLSHPGIREVAVIGVPGPSGTELVATVVDRGRLDVEQLTEFLEPLLPGFKRPTRYRRTPVLPRTELGRLDRAAVTAEAAEHLGVEIPAAIDDVVTRLSVVPGGQPKPSAKESALPVEPPEIIEVAYLDRLGSRLPGVTSRSQRSAADTDSDLFDDDLIYRTPAEPPNEAEDQPENEPDPQPTGPARST